MIGNLTSKIKPKETLKAFGFALLFATIFRTFFFQPFAIPSGSMMPNLIIGDRLLVQKFAYGYSKYSFPLNMVPFNGKILGTKKPKRGDIVVFKLPEQGNEYFIKRVIATPGDKVELKNGIVFVNNKPHKTDFVREDKMNIDGHEISSYMYKETNSDGFSYYIYKLSNNASLVDDNFAPVIIPKGSYFMLGDNRNNSLDSRYSLGYVNEDKIIGRARILFFSSSALLYEVWKFKDELYFQRIGKRLDKTA